MDGGPPLIQILRKPPELPRVQPRASSGSRCEFCGNAMDEDHGHLVDLPRRALLCVCRGCYLLFSHDGAGGARFRAVPTRIERVSDVAAADDMWEALDIPIGLAFFFTNGKTGRITAFYPSPASATESELKLEAWEAFRRAMPSLATLRPDVEALLVRRTERHRTAFIVPIDVCYELVGLIRVQWRGFQGGDELWQSVDEFFTRLLGRTQTGLCADAP